MALETLVAPAIEPLTLAQARAFLRVGTDGDDSVLTSLLIAAREALEARTGRALMTRTLRQRFKVPSHTHLPGTFVPGRVPATTLVAVHLIARDGSETAAPVHLVHVIDGRFALMGPISSSIIGLRIDYQAGYGFNAADVPEAFKVSILEAVAEALVRRDAAISGDSANGGHPWDPVFHEVKL